MRGRRFRRHSRGHRSSRRIRWSNLTYELDTVLESSIDHGPEYVSFWIKFPASTAVGGGSAIQTTPELQNIGNEPVDETLVRSIISMQAAMVLTGTSGVAPLCQLGFGVIPYIGGDQPNFYDFAVFQSNISAVSPPSVFADGDDPWIFRDVWSNNGAEVSRFDTTVQDATFCTSRAMRKLPAGMGLLAIVGVVSLLTVDSTPATVTMGGDIRYALKSGYNVS